MREDMVFVKGGKYKLYENNNIEVETFDLEVSKYLVTQKLWTDIMGRNPSIVKDILGMKPVENITWWHALQFCNKLSELEGLRPVYDLSQIKKGKLYKQNGVSVSMANSYLYKDVTVKTNGTVTIVSLKFSKQGLNFKFVDEDTVSKVTVGNGFDEHVFTYEGSAKQEYKISGNFMGKKDIIVILKLQ